MRKSQPKRGRQEWHNSKTYQLTAARKRELERRKTAYAKTQNRKLVNEILRHGRVIKTETFQSKDGRSVMEKPFSPSLQGSFNLNYAAKLKTLVAD